MVDETYTLSNGDAIQALDWNNSERTLHGYGVVDGAAVTINTGTLGTGNNALSVASGSAAVARTAHDVSAQSVSLAGADDLPRWDLVGVDTSGAVVVRAGTPEEAQIDGESTTETHRSVHKPIPPFDPDITPLALIWVPSNAGSVESGDLFDIRVPMDAHIASISGPIAGGSTVTNLLGSYLYINNSGSLTVAGTSMMTDVFDDGTETVSNTTTLNFGTNMSVTDPGDGSATIDASGTTDSSDIIHDDTQGGTAPDAHHNQTHDNADHSETYAVGNYEIQVDGTDGQGIINFHTQ